MAPHIDIKAGGPTFAWAYHALASSEADTFIILGTSHVAMENFFTVTRKSFETPFGILQTDQEFVNALAQNLPYDPFADELIHKSEHSIEFQVIFLQYLQRVLGKTGASARIVPILCGGSMHEALTPNSHEVQIPQLEESIAALQQVMQHTPNSCVIASVDFSHIGVRYGDAASPDAHTFTQVEHTDRQLLQALAHGDHQTFIGHLQQTSNRTQVCGYAPLYTLLRILNGAQGTLLHYNRTELSPGSFVSFASMVWNA